MSCDQFAKWKAKIAEDEDLLNADWIKKNSKSCPKCNVNIEKNRGCMHMTCKNCKHEFCWICMGNWKDHWDGGLARCNVYNEAPEVKWTKSEKNNFYVERFRHHQNVN